MSWEAGCRLVLVHFGALGGAAGCGSSGWRDGVWTREQSRGKELVQLWLSTPFPWLDPSSWPLSCRGLSVGPPPSLLQLIPGAQRALGQDTRVGLALDVRGVRLLGGEGDQLVGRESLLLLVFGKDLGFQFLFAFQICEHLIPSSFQLILLSFLAMYHLRIHIATLSVTCCCFD